MLLILIYLAYTSSYAYLEACRTGRRNEALESARRLESITTVASVPHLPDETILLILSQVFTGKSDGLQSWYEASDAQKGLAFASRTQKSWYRAGSSILYLEPVLLSDHTVGLFARTVSKKKDLSRMVQGLLMLRGPYDHLHHEMSSAAKECIASCTQLMSLILENQPKLVCASLVTLGRNLNAKYDLCRLSNLVITDSVAPWDDAEMLIGTPCLPALEVLHLLWVEFPSSYRFPVFPRLHTLHIIRPWMSDSANAGDQQVLEIDANSFPSLHSLQVHDSLFTIRLCPDVPRKLENLTYLDTQFASLPFFKTNNAVLGQACNVRSLILAALPDRLLPTSAALFPALEYLTIILPGLSATGWAENSKLCITSLSQLLGVGGLVSLKKIIVVLDVLSSLSNLTEMHTLRDQCALRQVEVEVEVEHISIRKWATSLTTTSLIPTHKMRLLRYYDTQSASSEIVISKLKTGRR